MHHNFGYKACREMFCTFFFFLSFNVVSTLRRPSGEKFEKRGKRVKNYLKIAIFLVFGLKVTKFELVEGYAV